MVLALMMVETLGVAFGACIVLFSMWLLYQWAIKPDRENRRQWAWGAIEKMHRDHWQQWRSGRTANEISRKPEEHQKQTDNTESNE